jgi:Tfp pilus assembly protein PilF
MLDWRGGLHLLLVLATLVLMMGCRTEDSEPAHVPRTAAIRALESATSALVRGDVARARIQIEEAVKEDPEYYLVHGVHGMVLAETGDHVAALAAMDRAVALNPDYGEGHLMRGVFLEQIGNRAEADTAYAQAIQVFDALAEAGPVQRTHRAVAVYLKDGRVEGIGAIDAVVRDFPQLQSARTARQKMLTESRDFFLRWAASADQNEDDV